MANPKTENAKKQLLKLLQQEEPLTLYQVCYKSSVSTELLIGALQSLWAKKDIIMDIVEDKDAPVGDGVVIKLNDGSTGGGTDAVNEQFISSTTSAARARLRSEVRKDIQNYLADGVPRTEQELRENVSLYGVTPESDPEVVVFPDGRYTLRSVEAGKAELQRRNEEAARRAETIKRQKRIVEDLLEKHGVLTEEQLNEALGEPLVPEAARDLAMLTDGKYTLPDSNEALEDIAEYIARREPVGSKEFKRMFKAHKQLLTSLYGGEEISPFIVLPDGRVTVEQHPAGQKELERRQKVVEVDRFLEELIKEHAFFVLANQFSRQNRKIAEEAAEEKGCVWIKYEGKTIWCSPLKHSTGVMAEELKALTGLDFPQEGETDLPMAYLWKQSVKPGEAARKLSLSPGQVVNLHRSGYLSGFNYEKSLRIWLPSLRNLEEKGGLEKILRRSEELNVIDAARILGVQRGMMRRLVREGYLEPVEKNKGKKNTDQFFYRGDVEDLLGVIPALKEKWETQHAQRLNKDEKRKPRRKKEAPKLQQGPFVLDRFQEEAIEALDRDTSVLVAAPTGTGKTVIAEKVVEKVLGEGREVIYTSPIKALSNQKFRDFSKLYGRDNVGLITGDLSVNDRASLLVMTTEIFRNWCFSNPEWMTSISYVIFDEIHYLDDPQRGTAWEESIIFAPPHIKMLGLSATVPNIREIADWMTEVRKYPVTVVEEKRRAVPLVIRWVTSQGEVLTEDEALEEIEMYLEEREAGYDKRKYSIR